MPRPGCHARLYTTRVTTAFAIRRIPLYAIPVALCLGPATHCSDTHCVCALPRWISPQVPAEARLRTERAEEMELQYEVMRGADVICCQMISAGGDFLARLGAFKAILVDEVAQVCAMQASKPGLE